MVVRSKQPGTDPVSETWRLRAFARDNPNPTKECFLAKAQRRQGKDQKKGARITVPLFISTLRLQSI